MKLDAYIRETGVSETELASRARCSQSYINKVRNGSANPTLAVMQRIADATGGEVTLNDLVSVADRKTNEASASPRKSERAA